MIPISLLCFPESLNSVKVMKYVLFLKLDLHYKIISVYYLESVRFICKEKLFVTKIFNYLIMSLNINHL